MIIGTNAYAPGLTARWVNHGAGCLSLRAYRQWPGSMVTAVVTRDAIGHGLLVIVRTLRVSPQDGYPFVDAVFTRRCDAKRAAEVLVGQWWREKCEREALRRRYARAMLAQGVPCFERLAMAARMAAASMNPLAAKGGDLDRLAEVYGVEARDE